MKRVFLLMLIICTYRLLGQNAINLVPNFSFEQYNNCPDNEDQIQYATGWTKYSYSGYAGQPFNTTPDYYNACDNPGIMGIPYTVAGYRPDPRGCNAFVGLVTIETGVLNYREYIGVQLNHSLIIGQKYYISFYIAASLAKIANFYYTGLWSNNIGLKLSTKSFDGRNSYKPDNLSVLNSSIIIKDTIKWHLISGSFISDSAYDYLIVGNFYDDSHTDTLHYNCNICQNQNGYYYIDDICLSIDSALCNGGINKLPCNEGINEIKPNVLINIFPNPADGMINIYCSKKITSYSICNLLGETILSSKNLSMKPGESIKVYCTGYPEGIYLIRVLSENSIITKKVLINH